MESTAEEEGTVLVDVAGESTILPVEGYCTGISCPTQTARE
jgi:hypothetical protein